MLKLFLLLFLTFISAPSGATSAYLVSRVSYTETNSIYRIDADFSTIPIALSQTATSPIMRGGPNSILKVGNVFFQTMWTTFGRSNQSLAYVSEDSFDRTFNQVKLIGTNETNCCKKNLRYLKNSHMLLIKNGSGIDYFELDPSTHLPKHEDLRKGLAADLSSFDVLSSKGRDYIVGISLSNQLRVYSVEGRAFRELLGQEVSSGKIKQIHALRNGRFLIQEEWALSLAELSLPHRRINILKTMSFSNDSRIKLTPTADSFIVFSEVLYAGVRFMDGDMTELDVFYDAEPDTFLEVISFFDREHFLMPVYHHLSDEYRLHLFKLDFASKKILRLDAQRQPFQEKYFIDLHEFNEL